MAGFWKAENRPALKSDPNFGIWKYRPTRVQSGAGEALEPEPVFSGRMVGDTDKDPHRTKILRIARGPTGAGPVALWSRR